MDILQWKKELTDKAQPERKAILSSFFKTGKGQYGEGDVFIGLYVPDNRAISKKYHKLPLEIIGELLKDKIHEFRLAALIALVKKYSAQKDEQGRKDIMEFYLANTDRINNWDLVDLSCPQIIGEWVMRSGNIQLLHNLSESACLWRRRIAIVSTYTLIKNGVSSPTLAIAEKYLSAKEDLIHKATGWMLREVGKADTNALISFLDRHAAHMPRTMLRYSLEKLPKETQMDYMKRKKSETL